MRQTLAILLTVFNRKDKTLVCLNRLYNLLPIEGYQVDVYLTDDGCTDGTPEAIASQFPDVHIIHGSGNLFWNRGMYTAWQEAAKKDYAFYLWLNDDTYVYSNMLTSLLEASSIKKDRAIIVGATQSLDRKHITYGGRLKNNVIPIPNGELIPIYHFNGNIVLIPRYVYNKLGNLDYYFTHSKGDFDYGLRALKAGIEMFQVGEYLGVCDLHETLDKWCNPDVPLTQRWKMLYRPNGMPPNEIFHLENRHYGLLKAIFHYITVHIRCLIPSVWINLNKINLKQK